MKKDILTGALVGLIVCLMGSTLYVTIMFSQYSLEAAFSMLYHGGLLPKVITLGTLPNVIVFHLFIKNNQVYKARGVLMAVIILAVVFAILKFV
ncbi:hypothetical protein ACXGQW_09995 [Wenyingzhuangia sp. IMCC45533]